MNNLKKIRWEGIAAIIAVIMAIGSIAFSFGISKSRMDTLATDMKDLKNLNQVIQVLDKNVVKLQTQLQYIEPTIQEIKEGLVKIDEKVDNLILHNRSNTR